MNMKNLLLLILLFLSVQLAAQNISGLYSGTLRNDSNKHVQQYELALSEYRGKITGYAYATFIANDTFYYSIRRVKAVREKNQLVVEDEEMLVNNFPRRPDKGVHRISYIPLQHLKEGDTLATFTGNWKTTQTKKFYAVPGIMDMKRDNDSTHSALVAHLRELNIRTSNPEVAVIQEEKAPPPIAKKNTTVKQNAATNSSTSSTTHEDLKKSEQPVSKPVTAIAVVATPPAYTERKKPQPQVVDIVSDSLVLSFYDNGVVDGDVISVYMNGEAVVAKAKLLEAATKKTIHIAPAVDSVELVLVAETLGSIPPNTGLLVVQDGNTRYQVRFSADLQTNAAIVFRKKKQQ
jgi:hypothetical protein